MIDVPDACFVDTNILLRVANRTDPLHLEVVSAFEHLRFRGWSLFISPQIAAEFWNVFTRPKKYNGLGSSPAQASSQLQAFTSTMGLLYETRETYERWLSLVTSHSVLGTKVHDARIAAMLQVHQVPYLLTQNQSDFARYSGFEILLPGTLRQA